MMDSVPGIVGSAVIMINTDTAVSKLNRIGFAKQDHAGPVKLLDRMGICGGNIFFEKTCSGSRR
jgi:hypothetical protein